MKLIGGSGCQDGVIRTGGGPASANCSAVLVSIVDKASPPGDLARRVILTIDVLLEDDEGCKEECALAGRTAGPRLMTWMVHHAAQVLSVCSVVTDGLTPFRRLKARKFDTHLAGCGERMRLREPPLEKVNKFSPRRVEARLLDFCVRSSRYIVVDCYGRFRLIGTVKRTSFEERWKIASPSGIFLGWRLSSKGARNKVNPDAQRLERALVDVLARGLDHEPFPRKICL